MITSSTSSLPIRQIKDVNLAWVRKDLDLTNRPEVDGPLAELRKSIDQHGLKLPILMTTTMLVADGARRLIACDQLGWKRIPVHVTSDWDVVGNYYADARELAAQGWPHVPMSWQNLVDLLNGPMKDLYQEQFIALRRSTRAQRQQIRQRGEEVEARRKGEVYTQESAQVLGLRESDLRTIREVHASLAKMTLPPQDGESKEDVAQRHAWAASITEQLHESERLGGERLYGVLQRVRLAARGTDPAVVGFGRGRRRADGSPPIQRKDAIAAGRELDLETLTNFTRLLSDLGDTAHYYTRVKSEVSVAEAAAAVAAMKSALRDINGMLRAVNSHVNNPHLEERTDS